MAWCDLQEPQTALWMMLFMPSALLDRNKKELISNSIYWAVDRGVSISFEVGVWVGQSKQWALFREGLIESQGRVAGSERESSDIKDCGILWEAGLMKPWDKSSVYFSVAVFFFFRICQ